MYARNGAAPTLSHNCVYGNNTNYAPPGVLLPGPGSISVDPVFVSGSYHLTATSQCVDTGDDTRVVSDTDLDGIARQIGVVDMGAYEVDNVAPTGTILINGGAAATNSTSVTLTLSADDNGGTGLDTMSFSNDGADWSAPEAFATSKDWTLASGGDGTRTVYVKYTDKAGNESQAYSASILLDTVAPTTPVVTDDGVWTTTDTQLHATWTSSDTTSGIAEYQYAIGTPAGATDVVGWTSRGADRVRYSHEPVTGERREILFFCQGQGLCQ